ncbi:G patch domain-containing protein 1 homolog [Anopheles bellator]|uniref:G patch domain-containing protein 1 homolog n=1 Tax=Anopheles bellator TaxID=139047 RepID=UPI0026487377|nr:G patch domain-containing protein 1 homolog [Anopheles bellator]
MEDDEETLCRYGTQLPAYEEDAVPSKKPIMVEDQIVLDSNGKRRFHGAFTGGFSAGYWNTVGSEEGWKPSEFKSSRNEKASSQRQQQPMDFMDEEDLGEFGIAPQRVQTKDDFAHASGHSASSKAHKRRLDLSFPSGPIPGQPVLRALLEPAKEKTAVRMLKNMGWREGQGVGERQTRTEKKRANERTTKEQYVMKVYGCEIPGRTTEAGGAHTESGSDSDCSDYEVTFAPDDFDPLVASMKDNTFGLGYSGLDRGGTAKGFNLFDTLEVVDKNNKKLSIRGQAFGIGALEDDDDLDVYARDDMSRYDFSLEDRHAKAGVKALKSGREANALEGFCSASNGQRKATKKVFRSTMPDSFKPRHWEERRSRFEPLDEGKALKIRQENAYKIRGLGRHDLDPKARAEILGEQTIVARTVPDAPASSSEPPGTTVTGATGSDKQTASETEPSSHLIPSGLVKEAKVLEQQYVGSTKAGFKPFIAYPDKQDRYEQFLAFQPSERYLTREQYLESLQPLNLSSWDRERERKEFMQAERMYRPLDGLMSDRFVTASTLIAENTITLDAPGEPRQIKMQRTQTMWKPHKDLCKRFNVPEPFGGLMADDGNTEEKRRKEKAKFSVFDYLEAPATNRRDFVTPVVIPRAAAAATPVDRKPGIPPAPAGQRISSKEFFTNDFPPTDGSSPSAPASNAVAPKRVDQKKPRTALEEQVLQATNKKPEEKRDLFRSIFCSTSDEESETDASSSAAPKGGQPVELTDEQKLKLVDSFVAIKPASEVNILRNNSPPRGIFKSLFEFRKPSGPPAGEEGRHTEDSESSSGSGSSSATESVPGEEDEGQQYYGPKLPTATGSGPGKANPVPVAESAKDEDVWIEKKKKKHKDHKDRGHHRRSKSKSSKHKREKKKHSKKHKNTKR